MRNVGAAIGPDELLQRERPLAIRGPGGSGKTTWMRWTFRRLLEMERAMPLMVVLRDLSRRWADPSCTGEARSLDAFLGGWVAENVGGGWEGELASLLAAQDGPRPVLLVDGWDELGKLGEELRRKLLGFMEQYPRLQVVVSSRPYGEGRPSGGEGFEVLDIQPLSDDEIQDLSQRFFVRCYGQDEAAADREAGHFRSALERSADAQALARTALLLTMMLLISRSRPLPDKRHLLYEACVENLLTALPDRKEQEGAQLQREQWRPDDSEERMRVVAALAFAVQEEGYKKKARSTIVRTWEEMDSLLPEDWRPQDRTKFLSWLAGPAALLVDRADGTLSLTHLSFQEYLAAWHLNAATEGDERSEAFGKLLEDADWWETLLLWAAIIERQSRDRLGSVIEKLEEAGDKGLAVVGMMLADGLGSQEDFSRWLGRLTAFLAREWSDHFDRCFHAWAGSQQEERKPGLRTAIFDAAPQARWLSWLRLEAISQTVFDERPPLPEETTLAFELVSESPRGTVTTARSVGAGRLFCGSFPAWPIEPWQIGFLQLWPGHRRHAGLRLQTALACGAPVKDFKKAAASILKEPTWDDAARDLARDLARYWARDLARDWARDWARYWARDWARYWARDWARYWARDLARDWARDLARDWARYWARDWARYFNISKDDWLYSYSIVDIFSFGRSALRAQLAHANTPSDLSEGQLLAAACRFSFHPESDSTEFEDTLERYAADLDPLWPALARHLARRSTAADRELLTDLARHPEKREPPLSWGLQFIVRGDVMDDDGNVTTLDELTDELGLPRLPYLEEMPDEIELPDDDELL